MVIELSAESTQPAEVRKLRDTPDVTVIIPTYNAMPYLRRCLDSVISQSLGLERLQVIAVNDGSTDGSAELLEAIASRHPDNFLVLHQENSGGPARPCNVGLDHATGRWVFFLGADDYLAPTALAQLVTKGDEWGSDVIFGTMRGENGRHVDQRIFKRTRKDVTFANNGLAYAVSNTKLFRRELIAENNIRYALDLRVSSDQPFVVEALTRARRVSVLADQVYYHAVKRTDQSNISYSMGWRVRLSDIAAIMDHIDQVQDLGTARDAMYARHFTWEVSKVLRREFMTAPAAEQAELLADIGKLVTRYCSPEVDRQLGPRTRVRLRLAQTGQVGLLREVIEYQQSHLWSPLVLRADGCYRWLPGFGGRLVDDSWYRLTDEDPGKLVARSFELAEVGLTGKAPRSVSLQLTGQIGVTSDSAAQLTVNLIPLKRNRPAPKARTFVLPDSNTQQSDGPETSMVADGREFAVGLTAGSEAASALAATLPVKKLVGRKSPSKQTWSVRLGLAAGRHGYDVPIKWPGQAQSRILIHRFRGWRVTIDDDTCGNLMLRCDRIGLTKALRAAVQRSR